MEVEKEMKSSMNVVCEVDIAVDILVGIVVDVEAPEVHPSAVNVTMSILQTPSPKPMQPQLLLAV